jgi:DNA-binding winged helix-turn-helix (wHTH) protein/PAS domain-containing protein
LIPDEEFESVRTVTEEIWNGKPFLGRMRVRKKDGTQLVIELKAELAHDEDGQPMTLGFVRDVTHEATLESRLKESEARLAVLNERLPLILWSCDPQLRYTWIWGSGLRQQGLEENELVGLTMFENFGTDDPNFEPIAAERRALKGQHVSYEMEWKDRHYRCTVEPHFGPMGEILGTIATAIDVTEARLLEAESRELTSQVGALRLTGEADWTSPTEATSITVGPLSIDVDAFEVRKRGEPVELTPTEFRLLVELATRAGRVLSRDVLLDNVWGHTFLGGGSLITMAVRRLRAKIEDDPANPTQIETIRGVGYKLRADPNP